MEKSKNLEGSCGEKVLRSIHQWGILKFVALTKLLETINSKKITNAKTFMSKMFCVITIGYNCIIQNCMWQSDRGRQNAQIFICRHFRKVFSLNPLNLIQIKLLFGFWPRLNKTQTVSIHCFEKILTYS